MIRLAILALLAGTAPALAWDAPECAPLGDGNTMCSIGQPFNREGSTRTVALGIVGPAGKPGSPILVARDAAWKFPVGEGRAAVKVDDGDWRMLPTAEDETTVVISLDGPLLEAIMLGQRLYVGLRDDRSSYPLDDIRPAVNALLGAWAGQASAKPAAPAPKKWDI